LVIGSTCGAPDVVSRAQPAGGDTGGSSTGAAGTGGTAGSNSSVPLTGGVVGDGGASSSGGVIGTGGKPSTGGNVPSGGTGATGGKVGSGGTSAGGGKGGAGGKGGVTSAGTGGTSAGGRGGTSGSTGAGGASNPLGAGGASNPFGVGGSGGSTDIASGGSGASGGAGGSSDTTPVPPPPTDGLAVWVDSKTDGSTGKIALTLRVDNKTSASVDMAAVTLRYWYMDEGLGPTLVFASDYVKIGYSITATVAGSVVAVSPAVAGADHYIELSFTGTLAAQGDKATNDQFNIHVTAHTANYAGAVDVTNDYSYDGGAAKVYEQKITLHDKSGKVIWGKAPGGVGLAEAVVNPADASVDNGDSGT